MHHYHPLYAATIFLVYALALNIVARTLRIVVEVVHGINKHAENERKENE